ncbi:benzoate-CoA ligase family protein [Azospirillum sp.]|uniref:benzoate-CoA ligase family protein n=1 Tax=Azospirillum sp. TaxID=34012 RepID=UPI002D5730A3|nr:benzoate-CoA ligase family protein [Azospirillum sp.]HYD69798.1 benzoate-CoA ligase family protein [Azospirillum sp.]
MNGSSASAAVVPASQTHAFNAAAHFIRRHLDEGRADKPAVIDDAGSYSYGDLAARAGRFAGLLRAEGVAMEERVALCLLDTIDFPTAFWGAIQAGVVPIPLNTLLTTKDYDYMLRDSRARVLVVSALLYEKVEPILGSLPFLRKVIVSGGDAGGHPRLDDLLADAPESTDVAPTTADDVAFWLYSSGSTGAPKGTMHLHRNLLATAEQFGRGVLGIGPDDVVFSAAKLFFAYGLGNGMTFPFHAGATAVLTWERPTPDSVTRVIAAHRPTVFFGVPTLYGAMLAAPAEIQARRSDRLRLCVSAGEALPEDVGQRWEARYGVPIVDGLGSTEMLHIFLCNRPGDVRYGTSGKAVPGFRLRIVDDEGVPVPDGELGELVVSGPSAAIGYWNQREKSLKTFRGPWTHTGDKYYVDADGYYHYAGRTDDMLKVSGNWVSPAEVEATLVAHPAVLEAAVIGTADEADLIKPKAFVVLKDGHHATDALKQELQAFIKSRLAPYKYPRWIEFMEALPKTATGKIQRFKLREQENAHAAP